MRIVNAICLLMLAISTSLAVGAPTAAIGYVDTIQQEGNKQLANQNKEWAKIIAVLKERFVANGSKLMLLEQRNQLIKNSFSINGVMRSDSDE